MTVPHFKLKTFSYQNLRRGEVSRTILTATNNILPLFFLLLDYKNPIRGAQEEEVLFLLNILLIQVCRYTLLIYSFPAALY